MNLMEAKNIIISEYPEFVDAHFAENKKGWSNYVVIIDNQYIFRFPRNQESRRMLDIEKRLLSSFRSISNLPLPHFEYVSKQSKCDFVGYRLIEGEELCSHMLESLDEVDYKCAAEDIAKFLDLLHSFEVDGSLSLENQLEDWYNLKDKLLKIAPNYFEVKEVKWLRDFFDDFLKSDYFKNPSFKLIHRDFSSDHILMGDDHHIAGIIDFGDIALGDPAFDFTGLYICYGKDFMNLVLSYYSPELDEDFLNRLESFYTKQVYFHDFLYAIELNKQVAINQAVEQIRRLSKLNR